MAIPYRVHRGFLNAWKEVKDIIIQKVTAKRNDGSFKWRTVTIVGYSHGAALAGLCHECVWFWRPDLRKNGLLGYGFESPRFYAGFKVRKELVKRWSTFTVIRNNNDIVTHCPPAFLHFTHVGKMKQVHGDVSKSTTRCLNCIKSHFPEVVYDGLLKDEE